MKHIPLPKDDWSGVAVLIECISCTKCHEMIKGSETSLWFLPNAQIKCWKCGKADEKIDRSKQLRPYDIFHELGIKIYIKHRPSDNLASCDVFVPSIAETVLFLRSELKPDFIFVGRPRDLTSGHLRSFGETLLYFLELGRVKSNLEIDLSNLFQNVK